MKKIILLLMMILFSSSIAFAQMTCPRNSNFGQTPNNYSFAYTSDNNSGYLVYDNFSGLFGPIEEISFWGMLAECCWSTCSEDPMTFEIKFYHDNAGTPGTEVASFTKSINGQNTGELHFGFPVYYYTTDLGGNVNLSDGWVSIQGVGSPASCWFLWINTDNGDGTAYQWSGSLSQLFHTNDDLSFCFSSSSIPTLPEWGLIIMGALFALFGGWFIIRKFV